MDSEFGDLQWSIVSKSTTTGFAINPCPHDKFGNSIARARNHCDLDMPGEEVLYKRTRVNFSSHLDGQHGGCDITEENVGGGTKNQKLTKIAKKMFELLISNGITITNKFRPTNQNKLVNQESRSKVDSSE